jgi:hypothetical protein
MPIEMKKLIDKRVIENAFFVHFPGERTNLVFGELAHVIAKQDLVVGERGERSRSG